ncbi:MAG: polysaccharide biosynthesis/export family protein, partial [candidate division KSB1 bacterium]
MNTRMLARWICLALLLARVPQFCLAQSEGEKQEYVIGVGDLLSIKFWQRPELDTEARVSSNGKIEMPLIGAIPAAGLTVSRLRQDIVNRISLLDIRVSQASIVVREFGSKIVYVTGAVLTPGKLKFETIPNLWQIILEAGGPQSYAQ